MKHLKIAVYFFVFVLVCFSLTTAMSEVKRAGAGARGGGGGRGAGSSIRSVPQPRSTPSFRPSPSIRSSSPSIQSPRFTSPLRSSPSSRSPHIQLSTPNRSSTATRSREIPTQVPRLLLERPYRNRLSGDRYRSHTPPHHHSHHHHLSGWELFWGFYFSYPFHLCKHPLHPGYLDCSCEHTYPIENYSCSHLYHRGHENCVCGHYFEYQSPFSDEW